MLEKPFARDDEARAHRSSLKAAGKIPFILDNDNAAGQRMFQNAKAGDKVTYIGRLDVDKSQEAQPVILTEVIPENLPKDLR